MDGSTALAAGLGVFSTIIAAISGGIFMVQARRRRTRTDIEAQEQENSAPQNSSSVPSTPEPLRSDSENDLHKRRRMSADQRRICNLTLGKNLVI
jgi:hypothetical protein